MRAAGNANAGSKRHPNRRPTARTSKCYQQREQQGPPTEADNSRLVEFDTAKHRQAVGGKPQCRPGSNQRIASKVNQEKDEKRGKHRVGDEAQSRRHTAFDPTPPPLNDPSEPTSEQVREDPPGGKNQKSYRKGSLDESRHRLPSV